MKPHNSKPKRSRTDKRECRIAISVTAEEKKNLQDAASDADLKLSEYLYLVAMNRSLRVQSPQFRQNMREVMSMANSMNQLAHAGNRYGFMSASEQTKFKDAVKRMYDIIQETLCK